MMRVVMMRVIMMQMIMVRIIFMAMIMMRVVVAMAVTFVAMARMILSLVPVRVAMVSMPKSCQTNNVDNKAEDADSEKFTESLYAVALR